jgi:hypothetical protein
MKIKKLFFTIIFISFLSCSKGLKTATITEKMYSSIKKELAPDKRIALFDIQFHPAEGEIILKGETTSKKAFSRLLDSLNYHQINYLDKVRILPDSATGNRPFAVAKNAVINIRSQPKHSAELGTQGLLGMGLKVLDKKGDFYRVQTPDNYISWVDKGGIYTMDTKEFDSWNSSKKVLFTDNFGYVYASKNKNSAIISDISLGGMLKYLSEDATFYEVKYPDNRTGFIKKNNAVIYDFWLKNLESTPQNIEIIAKKMNGFPYLWGGTSAKGMDCSGFTKMVYLMNGFIIPRDASQQINAGRTVDPNLKFEGLEKGDLLFFGKKATTTTNQRVTHVGIWLENHTMEFIHASGNVHISSMHPEQPNYDAFNKNRYLGSKRYLTTIDKGIVNLKEGQLKP